MRFNVAQLLKEGVGARRKYVLNEQCTAMPETGTTLVNGEMTITRVDKGVWVTSPIQANSFTSCSRCLKPYEYVVQFEINEEYLSVAEISNGNITTSEYERDVEDGTFVLDHSHNLDISEAIRQYVSINMPMKPLCNTSCAGLCLNCGTDLNDVVCACNTIGKVDPRLSPLLGLLGSKRQAKRKQRR